VVGRVEQAKEALVAVVPSARTPGSPLAEGLFTFEHGVREAAKGMAGWRHEELASEWDACSEGIAEALRRTERLRLEAPDLGFEPMLAAVGDLIAPLEAFEAAAERFRALGSRLR
jgi:hypothetical protein